jgi:hypothetical protein
MTTPKIVFIVPYRDREQQKFFFSKHMSYILENHDPSDYEIYFSHQCDNRTFNRGAMKNIGFLAMKQKYPDDYKKITFVFNDVDTIPYKKLFDYETTEGTIKHFYGFKFALGGIVSITGSDFEKMNGFPCYWGWGHEDNTLLQRSRRSQLRIDRDIFYELGNPNILHLFDGMDRIVTGLESKRFVNDNGYDGIKTIRNLHTTISLDSEFKNTYFINAEQFDTFIPYNGDNYYKVDLRDTQQKQLKQITNQRNIPVVTKSQEQPQNHFKGRFSLF